MKHKKLVVKNPSGWPYALSTILALTAAILLISVIIASHGAIVPLLTAVGIYLLTHIGLTASLVLFSCLIAAGTIGVIADLYQPGSIARFFKGLLDLITLGKFHNKLYNTTVTVDDTEVELSDSTEKLVRKLGKEKTIVTDTANPLFTSYKPVVTPTGTSVIAPTPTTSQVYNFDPTL